MMKLFTFVFATLLYLPALSECKTVDKKMRKERRKGNLGGASRDASKADCTKSIDISSYTRTRQEYSGSSQIKTHARMVLPMLAAPKMASVK